MLEIIEESLFRQSDTKVEAFNLEAYRELLLLYSVAKEIIGLELVEDAPALTFELPDVDADIRHPHPIRFMSTSIQPLSASVKVSQPVDQDLKTAPFITSVIPCVSKRLGLDIDLESLSFIPHD